MKIGISLSGGGIRAVIFHLGVLARIAKSNLLEDITFISSVSGGSLLIGLIFSNSKYIWPSSINYLEDTVPRIKKKLTSLNLEIESLKYIYYALYGGLANSLGKAIQKKWNIDKNLSDLPDVPRWSLCATSYETGKNWRFSKYRMGDYKTNYVINPDYPIAYAMAASAAYPGLIGPLTIHTRKYSWFSLSFDDFNEVNEEIKLSSCKYKQVHLWDGGLYENTGLEALYKPNKGLRKEIDFIIVSDASNPFKQVKSSILSNFIRNPIRLIEIPMDQVRSLRARQIIEFLNRKFTIENLQIGAYLKIGNTNQYIFNQAGKKK